jgi:hypothetical protein
MITIETSQEVQLDWTAKGSARKAQNVLNLINTWRYDVAYNRVMGLNPEILDKPFSVAAALYAADIYRLIQEYQPDVVIKDVQIKGIDPGGNIEALVVIEE